MGKCEKYYNKNICKANKAEKKDNKGGQLITIDKIGINLCSICLNSIENVQYVLLCQWMVLHAKLHVE